MYEHHLTEMADALVKGRLIKAADRERAKELLKKCWEDRVAIVWGIDDVRAQAKADGVRLSAADAREVLYLLLDEHDANIGCNWEVISSHIDWCASRRREKERSRARKKG